MYVEIFDVNLGQCAMIYYPNGKKIMIDTGHNASRNLRPSNYFKGQRIDDLIITNVDEDHVSDLINVVNLCSVNFITLNPTINSNSLASMKLKNGMGSGTRWLYAFLKYSENTNNKNYLLSSNNNVQIKYLWNSYGSFFDTNNLSLVTFVTYNGFTILFPGDLEVPGWNALLTNPAFCKELQKVNVLVASHHGRENGYCNAVFKYCFPDLVIVSDKGKIHSTQETISQYAYRARGCVTAVGDKRKVITTRKDGNVLIKIDSTSWYVFLEKKNTDEIIRREVQKLIVNNQRRNFTHSLQTV